MSTTPSQITIRQLTNPCGTSISVTSDIVLQYFLRNCDAADADLSNLNAAKALADAFQGGQ